MKKSLILAVVLAALSMVSSVVPASAELRNDTPSALACMKKYGFTYQEWRAYQVPARQRDPYLACRNAAAEAAASRHHSRRGRS